MKVSQIKNYNNIPKISFKSENKYDENKKNNKITDSILAATALAWLGLFFYSADYYKKKYENDTDMTVKKSVITNNDYQITKEMEDNYYTVLSNKLLRIKQQLPVIEYFRLEQAINKMNKWTEQ